MKSESTITVLGQKLDVLSYTSPGAFEPDYDAFYEQLYKSLKIIEVKGIKWRLNAHTDIIRPNLIVVRLRSIGTDYQKFEHYALEFIVDPEEMSFHKTVDESHLDRLIVHYFKDNPMIQEQFNEYVNELHGSDDLMPLIPKGNTITTGRINPYTDI